MHYKTVIATAEYFVNKTKNFSSRIKFRNVSADVAEEADQILHDLVVKESIFRRARFWVEEAKTLTLDRAGTWANDGKQIVAYLKTQLDDESDSKTLAAFEESHREISEICAQAIRAKRNCGLILGFLRSRGLCDIENLSQELPDRATKAGCIGISPQTVRALLEDAVAS